MYDLDSAIRELSSKRVELAVISLEKPAGCDLFTFGRAHGIQVGMKMAIDHLADTIRKAREDEAKR